MINIWLFAKSNMIPHERFLSQLTSLCSTEHFIETIPKTHNIPVLTDDTR